MIPTLPFCILESKNSALVSGDRELLPFRFARGTENLNGMPAFCRFAVEQFDSTVPPPLLCPNAVSAGVPLPSVLEMVANDRI